MVNLYDKTLAWTDVGATVDVKGYLDDWGLRERVLPVALKAWTDGRGGCGPSRTSPPTGRSPTTRRSWSGPVSTGYPAPATRSSAPRGSCAPRASAR